MSKIEVNTIEPQCGTTVTVGKCTSTVAVPGNVIKSNAVQASDGGNIVSQSGTDITLGASGDTINLASGASQSGFGRAGSVDWDTASIKTAGFSAVSGNGYFCNTNGGIFTVSLPAGSAGDIVALADYTRTFNTNNLTVSPNGSEKIGGVNADATLSVNGQSATFVYVDSTEGWINVQETQTSQTGVNPYIVATGGTPCSGAIVCTNYKVHTFTGPGTFTVTAAGAAAPCSGTGSNLVDYLVLAGGGSGGSSPANYGGGGAGAGGYRESPGTASGCYTASPLGTSPAVALSVPAQGYPITVGGGGAALGNCAGTAGNSGSNSIFSTITSAGGGGGGATCAPGSAADGVAGGSGGGGGAVNGAAGAGNTPPAPVAQGMPGGLTGTPLHGGGGGGGATQAGAVQTSSSPGTDGKGGDGGTSSITATPTARGGGGGGGSHVNVGGGGQTGGAGGGTAGVTGTCQSTCAAAVNTGGGTGGVHSGGGSGAGGSGVVIIRYKFQN